MHLICLIIVVLIALKIDVPTVNNHNLDITNTKKVTLQNRWLACVPLHVYTRWFFLKTWRNSSIFKSDNNDPCVARRNDHFVLSITIDALNYTYQPEDTNYILSFSILRVPSVNHRVFY